MAVPLPARQLLTAVFAVAGLAVVARTRRGRAGTVWPVDWVSAVLCPVMCPPWHGSRRACSDAPQGDGYYRGAVYHGALQMLQDEGGRLLAGKWVGFGKDGEINDGARTVRPRRRPAESRQAPANPPVNPPGSDDPVSTTGVPLAQELPTAVNTAGLALVAVKE